MKRKIAGVGAIVVILLSMTGGLGVASADDCWTECEYVPGAYCTEYLGGCAYEYFYVSYCCEYCSWWGHVYLIDCWYEQGRSMGIWYVC